MSITDRHKKPGGFRKLVNSLEITPPQKRDKILEAMKAEDPEFVDDVSKCVFNFEEFLKINDLMLCELISTLKEFKTLAMALYKISPELSEKFKKNMMPSQAVQFRDESSMISELKASEQMGARFRIIEAARALEKEGKIKIKSYNDKYLEE